MADVCPAADSAEIGKDAIFMSFFRKLPEKPTTTFRFFERNEYYSVHSADAEYLCDHIYNSRQRLKQITSNNRTISSVCLSKGSFPSIVQQLLLVKSFRVEIYKCADNTWKLIAQASPGNLVELEDVLFTEGTSAVVTDGASGILALHLKPSGSQMIIGAVFLDSLSQQLGMTQFEDSEYFGVLQTLIAQASPKECLVSSAVLNKNQDFRDLLARNGVSVTERTPESFNRDEVLQDLTRLLRFAKGQEKDASLLPETQHEVGLEALQSLMSYLQLVSSGENDGQFSLMPLDFNAAVRLDNAAIRALGLFPTEEAFKAQSLNGILNRARSACGQRLVTQWIRQPLLELPHIEERHSIVEAFVNETELRSCLYEDFLRRIPDLSLLGKKLRRKTATLTDLYKLYQVIGVARSIHERLCEWASSNCSVSDAFIKPLATCGAEFGKYVDMIEQTLDLDSVGSGGELMVRPDFDSDLEEIHDTLKKLESNMRKLLGRVANDLCLEAEKTVKLEYSPEHGYCFRVSKKDEKPLRNRSKEYSIVDVKNNGVRFRNGHLSDLNDEYVSNKRDYSNKQESIVAHIIDIAAGYSVPLQQVSEVLSRLDALVGFAVAAVSAPIPYVRPNMHPRGSQHGIHLKGLRHPYVEQQLDATYIANDIRFKKDEATFYVITGPNMGGKSTYIRSVALAVLMAQIGSFVPCEAPCSITCVDAILGRVGASDQQIRGISTFMAEMIETSFIVKTATSDSLIIVDELGRGTSTYDGYGLAYSISQYIVERIGCFCVFATHFHELTELADEYPTVKNRHVSAHVSDNKLTLLYTVADGASDKSLGIEVAELAHLPHSVVGLAKQMLVQFKR